MEAKAYLRHARISPRKVQIVLDLIRNKPVEEAAAILALTPKAACEPLAKLLKSAVANAENNLTWIRIIFMSQSVLSAPVLCSREFVPEHRAEHSA